MNFELPKLKEWNDYYPCPFNKVRMVLKLSKPVLFIDNYDALHHDFYYLSDEFSVIFHPLKTNDNVCMLVEGPHINPQGERIPILSTWSHLKLNRGDVAPHGIHAFYDGKWWTAELSYNYDFSNIDFSNIDVSAYKPLYWCGCVPGHELWWPVCNNKHSYYLSKNHYTLFSDKTQTEFYSLMSYYYEEKGVLPIVADWLEEHSDPLAQYVREIKKGIPLPELVHMCYSIKEAKNDRSARLLLLAEGIKK